MTKKEFARKINASQSERELLGALMLWPEDWKQVREVVTPYMFLDEFCSLAAIPIFERVSKGQKPDDAILATDLEDLGFTFGDVLDLKLVACERPVIPELANIVRQNYLRFSYRDLFEEGVTSIDRGDETGKVVTSFVEKRKDLEGELPGKSETRADIFRRGLDSIIERAKTYRQTGQVLLRGANTGYPALNDLFGGWVPGRYTIIAARPGMGKTRFAVRLALHAASQGEAAHIVSIEMSEDEIFNMLLSLVSGIPYSDIDKGKIDEGQERLLFQANEILYDLPITWDHCSRGIFEVSDRIRKRKEEIGTKVVFIDYLQLLVRGNEGRHGAIGEVSRSFKLMAAKGDCNMHVIALSQLSREVEKRGNKRPQLPDLRESGSLEEDADHIIFLYRPSYYANSEEDRENRSYPNDVEVDIAKNRHGRLETVHMTFWPETGDFTMQGQQPIHFHDEPRFAGDNRALNGNIITVTSRANTDEDIPF